MSAECAPGTVAMVTFASGRLERSVRRGGVWMFLDNEGYGIDANASDVRPLVVLDLDAIDTDPQPTAEYIVCALRAAEKTSNYTATIRQLADQIEAQTKPPKPAEPTGLGAVVEDAHGRPYQRTGRASSPWLRADIAPDAALDWRDYTEIDVSRVLSEGVA